MTAAREEVLARIRTALGPAAASAPPAAPVPRDYRPAGSTSVGEAGMLHRFVDRVRDYRATVRLTRPDGLAQAVAEALAHGLAQRVEPIAGRPRVVVPPGLPEAWLAALDAEVVRDDADGHGLDALALDDVHAVVTAAAVAVAETGTIVLDGSADQGRRAITLVPDLHVCVVAAGQVVAAVPDAVARLEPTRPQTWISGPSATSDIELDRVEGVHGPRTLEVVVIVEP